MKRVVLAAVLLMPTMVWAEPVRVAVASNFIEAARSLSEQFEQRSGHRVTLAFGSTGKHYAQIVHGAPFDLFLAADSRRPKLLEEKGIALANSRFSYAIGRLVLWSKNADLVDDTGAVLENKSDFRYLAIANPKLAPYGQAAQQVLQKRGLWPGLKPQLLRGENINQAFHFVHSGNADLGFIAWAQLRSQYGSQHGSKKTGDKAVSGSYWLVPAHLHQPIAQQAVQLTDRPGAAEFARYLQSDEAREIIRRFGYETP